MSAGIRQEVGKKIDKIHSLFFNIDALKNEVIEYLGEDYLNNVRKKFKKLEEKLQEKK